MVENNFLPGKDRSTLFYYDKKNSQTKRLRNATVGFVLQFLHFKVGGGKSNAKLIRFGLQKVFKCSGSDLFRFAKTPGLLTGLSR